MTDIIQNILLVVMILVSGADYVADRQLEKKIDQVLKKRERRRGAPKPGDEPDVVT
jgi:hypothetical protein